MLVDRDKALPIYHQMAEDLRRNITSGKLAGMLPAENQLSESYKVGRNTTRNCLKKLESEGLIYRINGKGAFVSPGVDKKIRNLLLVVDRLAGGPYESLHSLIAGAAAASHEAGAQVQLILISQLAQSIELVKYDDRFQSAILFLLNHILTEDIVTTAEKSGLPFLITGVPKFQKYNFLDIDNRYAMRGVVDRLFELGHRRFGVATFERESDAVGHYQQRVEAVVERLNELGLSLPPELLVRIDAKQNPQDDSFVKAFLRKDIEPPTAIVCVSDTLARLSLQFLRRHNYRVPQDISVTGFDDHEVCQFLEPPLSSVHVDYFQIGNTAAGMLLELLNNFSLRRCQKLCECDLVVRESIGTAPSCPVSSL